MGFFILFFLESRKYQKLAKDNKREESWTKIIEFGAVSIEKATTTASTNRSQGTKRYIFRMT